MRSPVNTLTPRIVLGSGLLAAFVALVFVSLIGAKTMADRADSESTEVTQLVAAVAAAQQTLGQPPQTANYGPNGAAAASRVADLAGVGPQGKAIADKIRGEATAFATTPSAKAEKKLDADLEASIAAFQADAAEHVSDRTSSLKRLFGLGVIGLIGALLAIAVLATGLVRLVTQPIRKLAEAAKRLGAGDLTSRVPETGVGDLRDLGASLNAMAAAVEKSRSALADQASNLTSSREEAEDANRAKSEFLSRMSHELRTPLNAILGFAQLLQLDDLEARQKDNVAHIVSGGRHLLDLINEVLEISRLEVGTLAPTIAPVHAATVLREAVELVSPLAAQRKIELKTVLGSEAETWVEADQQRLKQVMLNLLANAVKYNRDEGNVTVTFKRADSKLRILVTDTGQGIAQDQVHKLFIPFERLGAEKTGVEGTGLGLVLALRLMEAMGGTLGVESQPWIGSTFHAELNITEAPDFVEPVDTGPDLEQTLQQHAYAAAAAPADGNGRLTVLYVEDDLANLRLMSKLFEEAPEYELMTTMQGKLGIELARQHHPVLILLDVNLPDLHGADVLRRLREDPATRDIPVIVVSADATEETIRRMRIAGAVKYLTKPIQLEIVLGAVRDVLGAAPVAGVPGAK